MNAQFLFSHFLAFATTSVWGLTFISTKVLLENHSPLEIILYRFFVACVAMTIMRPHRFQHGQGWRMEAMFAGAGLCGITLYFILENIALTYTYASNISLIICTAPFFTGIAARFFLGEKLHGSFFSGFIVAITGIAMISFSGATELGLNPRGDILAVMAAMSWAFYSILTRKIFRHGFPLVEATRRIMAWGLVLSLLFVPFEPQAFTLPRHWQDIGNILFLGVVASFLGFIAWNYALHHLGAVSSSAYIYLSPVVTILGAVVLIDEQITLMSGIGMILTFAGLLLSERHSFLPAKSAQPKNVQETESQQ